MFANRITRVFTIAALLLASSRGRAADPVQYVDTVGQHPLERMYVARIDLTNPQVSIIISPGGPRPAAGIETGRVWDTTLRPPSEIAKALDLDVAVNGSFFIHRPGDGDPHHYNTGEPALCTSLVMIDGQIVTAARVGAALGFDAQNHASIFTVDKQTPPPTGMRQIIAGNVRLVAAGKNVAGVDEGPSPRTAVGLAEGGKTLVVLVVDGRRETWSAGMTLKELADAMIQLGCADAINLDGGGSSVMVRKIPGPKYKVINTPSDGSTLFLPLSVERPVAYTFGVRIHPRP